MHFYIHFIKKKVKYITLEITKKKLLKPKEIFKPYETTFSISTEINLKS